MHTPLDEVMALMMKALSQRGIVGEQAEFIVHDYIDAELEGKPTHGIGKFLLIDHVLDGRQGPAELISQIGSFATMDGHREIGQIAARSASLEAVRIAVHQGVGLVTLKNFSRFGRLGPYSRLIAANGMVGIVLNNAGPAAVAPYGSRNPILGTNPIAFGFPAANAPVVIDFATSKRVWGEIRQAALSQSPLPPSSFLDSEGDETVEPAMANAVLPFGDHKGSALCLAIELLAGTLVGAAMGGSVQDEYELGAVFVAIRPADNTSAPVTALLQEIAESMPLEGIHHVRVPGQRSSQVREERLRQGWIDVADSTYEILLAMSEGCVGLKANNLSN
ncbi:Ldh family oxidoreductase [Acrocarpospora sp. B8E8]|uniref:Ldh family oxidoreductase n=1 Tax=Acrocarpospora sp. B8E8 TaxID=3153572 RepID=UPI00325E1D88